MKVWGLGFRDQGLRFRDEGLWDLGMKVLGLGGLGMRV